MRLASKPMLKCLRCGYSWTPRGDVEPERIKSCPDCKHRKWREAKPAEDFPHVFENLFFQPTEKPRAKLELVSTEKPIQEPELPTSREYDQYRKARMREAMRVNPAAAAIAGAMKQQSTEKLTPKPEQHTCYDCGEPAEYSIDATDLNFTDRGTEYITYQEWFCAEHYQERTKDLP